MTDDMIVKAGAPSTKRQAALLLVLVLLAGLMIGIAADRFWLTRHWGRGGRPGGSVAGAPRGGPGRDGPPGMMRGGLPPGMSPERDAERRRMVVKRLTRELDLTSAQQRAVDSIMAANEGEFRALEQEMRPRMRVFLERSRAQIDSVLTPEQREKFHKFGPPEGPHRGPLGMPGEPPPPEPGALNQE